MTAAGEIRCKRLIGSGEGTRWESAYQDILGRTIKTEHSGFNGAVVTDSYLYNEKNQLAKIARTGQPTVILGYDALGNRTQTGWNGDGLLSAASSDRIVIDETGYLKENGNWFLHRVQSYGTLNDDTATAVAQTKEQLSGLPTGTVAVGSGIDIYGNITTQSAEIDRSAKTITVSAVAPARPKPGSWFTSTACRPRKRVSPA